jgi:hypothetical protein
MTGGKPHWPYGDDYKYDDGDKTKFLLKQSGRGMELYHWNWKTVHLFKKAYRTHRANMVVGTANSNMKMDNQPVASTTSGGDIS